MEWLTSQSLGLPLQAQIPKGKLPDAGRVLLTMLDLGYSVEQINHIVGCWFADLEDEPQFDLGWQCMQAQGCVESELGLAIGPRHQNANIDTILGQLFDVHLGVRRVRALLVEADPLKHGWVSREAFKTLMKASSPFGHLGELIEQKQEGVAIAMAQVQRLKVLEKWVWTIRLQEIEWKQTVVKRLQQKTWKLRQAALLTSKLCDRFGWVQLAAVFAQWNQRRLQLRAASMAASRLCDGFGKQQVAAGWAHWKDRRLRLRRAALLSAGVLESYDKQQVAATFVLWKIQPGVSFTQHRLASLELALQLERNEAEERKLEIDGLQQELETCKLKANRLQQGCKSLVQEHAAAIDRKDSQLQKVFAQLEQKDVQARTLCSEAEERKWEIRGLRGTIQQQDSEAKRSALKLKCLRQLQVDMRHRNGFSLLLRFSSSQAKASMSRTLGSPQLPSEPDY